MKWYQKGTEINKIVHLADIHIRTGNKERSRYDEYFTLFDEMHNMLKNIVDENTIIIICGDVMHDFCKIEEYGLDLFHKFIDILSSLCYVYCISGNHDCRRACDNDSDMLKVLFKFYDTDNVVYLNETDNYMIGNLGIGFVAQKDVLTKEDTFGRIANLPQFPPATKFKKEKIQHKIAIFHGTVIPHQIKEQDQKINIYPLNWFDGYDSVLLGDLHEYSFNNTTIIEETATTKKFKINEKQQCWGYSGSLCQQNFGEDIANHGFAVWNLQQKSVDFYHVKNKYGFLYVKHENEMWYAKIYKQWIRLEKALLDEIMPKTLYVQIFGNMFTIPHKYILQLRQLFINNNKQLILRGEHLMKETITKSIDNNFNLTFGSQLSDNLLNWGSKTNWIQYLEQQMSIPNTQWQEYILNPNITIIKLDDNMHQFNITDKINNLNKNIIKEIELFQKEYDISYVQKSKQSFKIRFMKWSWMICYGEDCYFNFDGLDNNISCINSKNGVGKSSLFDIICLSLFGESMPSRQPKTNTDCQINYKKPKGKQAHTSIIFMLGNTKYTLNRTFDRHLTSNISSKHIDLYCNDEKILSGNKNIDTWIQQNIGSINDFLLGNMFTQNNDNSFFGHHKKKQMALFDENLNLVAIRHMNDLLHCSILAHDNICKEIQTIYDIKNKLCDANYLQNICIDEQLNEVLQLAEECKQLDKKISQFNEKQSDITISDEEIINEINKLTVQIENISIGNMTKEECIIKQQELLYNLKLQPIRKTDIKIKNIQEIKDILLKLESIKYDKPDCDSQHLTLIFDDLSEEVVKYITLTHETDINQYIEKYTKRHSKMKSELSDINIQLHNLYEENTNLSSMCTESDNCKFNKQEIKKNKDEFEKTIIVNYKSINEFESICSNVTLVVPSMDKSTLEYYEKNIRNIKKVNRKIKNMNVDIDNLDRELAERKTNLVNLQNKFLLTKQQKNQLQQNISLNEIKYEAKNNEYKQLKTIVPIFKYTEEECKINILRIEKNIKLIDKKRHLYTKYITKQNNFSLLQETLDKNKNLLDSVNENIKEIQNDNHPFNAECQSCKQQWWKKKLDLYLDEEKAIESKIKDIINKMKTFDIIKIKQQIDILSKFINQYENDINYYDLWKATSDDYIKYKETNKQKQLLEIELSNISNELKNFIKQISELDICISEQKEDINILKNEIEYIEEYIVTQEIFVDQQNLLDVQKKAWTEYEYNTKILKDKQDYTSLKNEISHCEFHEQLDKNMIQIEILEKEKSSLEHKIANEIDKINAFNRIKDKFDIYLDKYKKWNIYNEHQIQINAYQTYLIELELENIANEIENITKKQNMEEKLQSLINIQKNRERYKKYIKYKNEKKTKENILNSLKEKYYSDKAEYTKMLQIKEELTILFDCKKDLLQKRDILELLYKQFQNYKKWIYNKIVIKNIVDSVNKIINIIMGDNSMKIECSLEEENNTDVFEWYMKYENNRINLVKASGGQKTLLEFAIRIALILLGTNKTIPLQLFIDENFVFCDADKIKKIPKLIENILSIYDSILIVSHVDAIKDVCNIHIPIMRHDGISIMKFGNNVITMSNMDKRRKK